MSHQTTFHAKFPEVYCWYIVFKGTVSTYFHIRLAPYEGHYLVSQTILKIFEYNFDFAEIFEFKEDPVVRPTGGHLLYFVLQTGANFMHI